MLLAAAHPQLEERSRRRHEENTRHIHAHSPSVCVNEPLTVDFTYAAVSRGEDINCFSTEKQKQFKPVKKSTRMKRFKIFRYGLYIKVCSLTQIGHTF